MKTALTGKSGLKSTKNTEKIKAALFLNNYNLQIITAARASNSRPGVLLCAFIERFYRVDVYIFNLFIFTSYFSEQVINYY